VTIFASNGSLEELAVMRLLVDNHVLRFGVVLHCIGPRTLRKEYSDVRTDEEVQQQTRKNHECSNNPEITLEIRVQLGTSRSDFNRSSNFAMPFLPALGMGAM
jgi:hypothetical protein